MSNKEIAIKLDIGQSAVTNILNGRYKAEVSIVKLFLGGNEEYINEFIEKINTQIEL